MDNNLPNDPENNSNPSNGSPAVPPAFGTSFDPHTNPQDPNNPYQTYQPPIPPIPTPPEDNLKDPAQSEVAKHQARGPDGKFISSEHTVDPALQTPSTPSNPSFPSNLSAITTSPSFSQRLKSILTWISKIKWGRVSAYIVGFVGVISLLFSLPAFRNWVDSHFPSSSPVFGREISMQGVLKSSSTGLYTLVLPDGQAYTLHFKPSASLTNLKKLNEVVVKGRLGWTSYVIEDAEIYPLNFTIPNEDSNSSTSQTSPNTQTTPNPPNSSNPADLPKLYPNLTWEITQTKTLIFTSGKRKIEQQGVYLESSQVDSYPQDFIDYYTNQLINLSFKQTLDSKEPSGTTTTYSKEDTFLTFGVKNVFKGSGDNKKIVGYKAYIEHN